MLIIFGIKVRKGILYILHTSFGNGKVNINSLSVLAKRRQKSIVGHSYSMLILHRFKYRCGTSEILEIYFRLGNAVAL